MLYSHQGSGKQSSIILTISLLSLMILNWLDHYKNYMFIVKYTFIQFRVMYIMETKQTMKHMNHFHKRLL